MFVCVCNAVTERDIGSAVAEGCRSLRELRAQLGVGAQNYLQTQMGESSDS